VKFTLTLSSNTEMVEFVIQRGHLLEMTDQVHSTLFWFCNNLECLSLSLTSDFVLYLQTWLEPFFVRSRLQPSFYLSLNYKTRVPGGSDQHWQTL